MASTTKRRFTDEFKREAVALWETSGRMQTEVAAELGIMTTMLRRWQRKLGDNSVQPVNPAAKPPVSAMTSPADQASEIAQLRRELDRARMERDILKKPSASLRRCRDEVRFYRAACVYLAGERHVPHARRVAQRLLRLRVRAPIARTTANLALLHDVRRLQARHQGRYRSPRMHAALRAEGRQCSRGRVERLMRRHCIHALAGRRSGPARLIAVTICRLRRTLLVQRFVATALSTIWLADITYIATGEGWLYLAAELDLATRKIVGLAMRDHMRTELPLAAMMMAAQRQRPDRGVICHSEACPRTAQS